MGQIDILSLLAIAVALAMDAFAVALAAGVSLGRAAPRQYFRLAWHFGLFQALMPIAGWAGGNTVRIWIERYAHWVAFGLLVYVAQGMLRSSLAGPGHDGGPRDPTRGTSLVMLALATSIDALAVGFSLSMLEVVIWIPALVIGMVALIFTAAGLYLGGIFRKTALGTWAGTAGALVLLAIGIRILLS